MVPDAHGVVGARGGEDFAAAAGEVLAVDRVFVAEHGFETSRGVQVPGVDDTRIVRGGYGLTVWAKC